MFIALYCSFSFLYFSFSFLYWSFSFSLSPKEEKIEKEHKQCYTKVIHSFFALEVYNLKSLFPFRYLKRVFIIEKPLYKKAHIGLSSVLLLRLFYIIQLRKGVIARQLYFYEVISIVFYISGLWGKQYPGDHQMCQVKIFFSHFEIR